MRGGGGHVRSERPRFAVSRQASERLANAFADAVREGDLAGLSRLLAADATFVSDGGGKVASVPKPLSGRDRIAQVLLGFAKAYRGPEPIRFRFAWINGLPGFVLSAGDGVPIQTIALEPGGEGEIAAIYVVRNPEKLVAVAG